VGNVEKRLKLRRKGREGRKGRKGKHEEIFANLSATNFHCDITGLAA
jgi:hypothetical protein